MKRDHNGASPCVIRWILLLKARSDRIHLGLHLLQSDARLNASSDFNEMITTLRRFFGWERNRHPKLIVPVIETRQLHQGRHDANDSVALAVQSKCAADNARIGSETPLP